MMTLEQAINRIEDMVSGCYQQQFPHSELRINTKDSTELIKFNLMTIIKVRNDDVRLSALDTIMRAVLDDTPLPTHWQKKSIKTYLEYCTKNIKKHMFLQHPDIVEECIDCCEVILKRLEQVTPDEEEQPDHTLEALNRRFYHKYFYFRNEDVGSQYVWVKQIHKNDHNHFLLDGTVIYTNGINNTIGLYETKDTPIEDFYNFGDKKKRFTTCEELEEALMKPMDTRLKSHVITCREAAEDILFIFTWFYEIHIPEMARILKTLKLD